MSPKLFDMQPDPDAQAPIKPIRNTKLFNDMPARDQMTFAPRSTEDFVAHDAPVRALDEIMEQLDYAAFEERYRGGGRPAWPPKLMAKLLLFGYCQGIRSAREISRRLERDLHFMWLGHEQHIDHQRLSEFRRDFAEQLRELFTQTVRLALEMGLTTLELVAIDGSKIAANAGRRMLNDEELQRAIDKVLAEAEATDAAEDAEHGDARGDELPDELADRERRLEKLREAKLALDKSGQKCVSLTEPEAPVQKIAGEKRPGLNAQLAVDGQSGMIVGQDVVGDQNDTAQFGPMAAQTLANTGFKPQATVGDRGYHSGKNLRAADELDLNAFMARQSRPASGRFEQDDFEYDEQADEFVCPAGKRLSFRREQRRRGPSHLVYATSARDCRDCPLRARCLSAKGKRRELYVSAHAALARRMAERMDTDEGRRAMRRRGPVVESVFGVLKSVLGLRQFLLRGLSGARVELTLCATGLNLRKLAAAS
jgi:transposase